MKIFNIKEFEIYNFRWDIVDSNMFLIEIQNEIMIVDPVITEEVIGFLSKKKTYIKKIYVFLTHEHFDHINGLNWIRNNFDTTAICNDICSEKIKKPSGNLSDKTEVLKIFNNSIKKNIEPFSAFADIIFKNNYNILWKNHTINLKTLHGHTAGSIIIILDNIILFSGDTLLSIPTITRLPGGNRKEFFDLTIPFLYDISKNICIVMPGHGDPGTIDSFLSQYSDLP